MKKIIFYIAILILIYYLIKTIIFPSYLSVKSSCFPEKFEEQYGDKYETQGRVSLNLTNNETKLFIKENADISILKHELCHINQINKERLYFCNNLIGKYLNELECYSIQRYWQLREII